MDDTVPPAGPVAPDERAEHAGGEGERCPNAAEAGTATLPWPALGVPDRVRARAGNDLPTDPTGRYRIESLRGSGGMGRVYKAWDCTLSRPVALKILHGDDQGLIERFSREAVALARIEHPNICTIYEVTKIDGRPAIAMKYVEGPTLLEAASEMSVEQKVAVMLTVAEALHATHRIGLVHRDLKPANILVETGADGSLHPYVVDFGLVWGVGGASLTATGATVGTPSYMAPEQASMSGAAVDRRVDVYGLGATLYALLTGQPPFSGETPIDVMVRVVTADPVAPRSIVPTLPADLETITLKCLRKEPHLRYESARAVADDLRRYLDGEPILARPASLRYRLARRLRRNRATAAVTAGAALAIAALGVVWIADRRAAARQSALAQQFTQKVESMESVLWRARSLPPHDIVPTEAMVRTRLREIEAEVERIGRVAEKPGHSALGRCYLALFEYEKARTHLEKALQHGDKSPAVSYALGLTLGQLYERGLADLERERNEARRREGRARLVRELRDPAVGHLRRSRGLDVASADYVEALLAFYEDRNEDALRLAKSAYAKVPWLFEARLLEGEVHAAVGREHRNAGRLAPAAAAYAQADAALREAARIAESDVRTYTALCSVGYERLYLEFWVRGQWSDDILERAIADCTAACEVNRGSAQAFLNLGMVLETQVEHLGSRGKDPTAVVERALAATAEAVRLDPGNFRALGQLGSLYWQQGKKEFQDGLDPRASFRQSAAFIEKALAIHPRDDHVLNNLGLTLLDLGLWEASHELDPTPSIERAIEAFEASGDTAHGDWIVYTNVGAAYQVLLGYQVDSRTGDVEDTSRRGIEALERAIAINPATFWPHRFLGDIHLSLARHELSAGKDPTPRLRAAVATLERALALNPNDTSSYTTLARARLLEAERALLGGRSPDEPLAHARAAIKKGLAVNPGLGSLLELQERLARLETRRSAT